MKATTSQNRFSRIHIALPAFRLILFILFSLSLLFSSCYNNRILNERSPEDLIYQKKTQWNYCWGIIKSKDIKVDCPGINEVNAKTNLGYIFLSAITLGIVVPQQLEWRCEADYTPPANLGEQ